MKQICPKYLFLFLLFSIILAACSPGGILANSTATPTATPTLPPTSTLEPTATELPPTKTPEPTNTAEPSNTPEATGWDRYIPRSMAELVELVEENFEPEKLTMLMENENAVVLEVDPTYQHASFVPMIYQEEFRALGKPRDTMISVWVGTVAPNFTEDQIKELISTEVLFSDGENEYWMPIQTPVLEYLKDEFKAGDEVALFIVYIGSAHGEDAPEYVFMINEYEWE